MTAIDPQAPATTPGHKSRALQWLVAAVVLWVIVVGAFLVFDATTGRGQPPGCAERDKAIAGCRPIGRSATQFALPFGTIVVTPVVALFVALLTASTTDRRQERALDADKDRLTLQLEAEYDRHTENARFEADRQRRAALREVCADFTAALVRMRYFADRTRKATPSSSERATLAVAIRDAHEQARVGFERLRILSESDETQRAGRFALRHAYSISQEAETGRDPRADEFLGESPHDRFHRELQALYISIRQELDIPNPSDVFPEPEG